MIPYVNLKLKKFWGVILTLFSNFQGKPGQNGSKNQKTNFLNVFYNPILHPFLGLDISFSKKKFKIVSPYERPFKIIIFIFLWDCTFKKTVAWCFWTTSWYGWNYGMNLQKYSHPPIGVRQVMWFNLGEGGGGGFCFYCRSLPHYGKTGALSSYKWRRNKPVKPLG